MNTIDFALTVTDDRVSGVASAPRDLEWDIGWDWFF